MVAKTRHIYSLILAGLACIVYSGQACSPNPTAKNVDSKTLPFSQGGVIVSEHFIGKVHLNMLVDADSVYEMNVGNVSFQPGARTNWHSHPGGQILLVVSGKGFYQEKGKPKRVINMGDVIKCPPDVPHWHGATPKDTMVHIAIGPNLGKGSVSWQDAVNDSTYHSRPA